MCFLYKKFNYFLLFIMFFCASYAFSGLQGIAPSDSLSLKCSNADSSYFHELKIDRMRLSIYINDIRKGKDEFEKDGYKSGLTTREYKKKLNKLESDLKKAERDLNRINTKMNNIMRKIENNYSLNGKDNIRFYGNCTVEPAEKINSNVSVMNGEVLVKGKIDGNLVLVNSEAKIIENGIVTDRIIMVNSSVKWDSVKNKPAEALCGEKQDYYVYDYSNDDYSFDEYSIFNRNWPEFNLPHGEWFDQSEVRYNRVEGFRIGIAGGKKYYWNTRKKYSLYGSVGYGFANHRWTGSIAFDRWIGNENRTEAGVEAHSIIDSKDNWLIDPMENSAAAFFIHEDFKDYFLRDGWSAHISQYIAKNTRIRIDYAEDNYLNQERNTDWALFGGSKTFRLNPAIDQGRYKSIVFSVGHSSPDLRKYHVSGFNLSANYEITTGPMDYHRLWVDLRSYQPLFSGHQINARVILGTSNDMLPAQKSFDLGGIGSIPALPFKYDAYGNRMVLFNVEYLFAFDDIFDMLFDNDFNTNVQQNFVVFYDGGWVNRVCDCTNMFEGLKINNNYRHDAGAAFGFDQNRIRIGAAFRLDKTEPAVLFLRISKPI